MDIYPYIVIGAICLALGLAAGFIMHRSNYCIAGAFRDLFLFKRTLMLKSLFVLVITSMVLFEGARVLGLIAYYPFPLLYAPTPANVIGGFLFGTGMVLAGGCVVGTLFKMGAGSVLSAVTLLGLIIGSALYAEIHPSWAAFIKQTTVFQGKVTVPQILQISPTIVVAMVAAAGTFLILSWMRAGKLAQRSHAEGFIQPWRAAVMLSVIGLISYVLIGMPMGVTSSYAKLAGYCETVVAPEHLDKLAYFKAMPLKYINPVTGISMEGGGGPKYDAIGAIQFPLVAGIILGSALSALLLREFHVIFKAPARQYVSAITGGMIMGLASRMAPTCNVWHLMGGLPILAASSLLFLAGLLPGAWFGGRLLLMFVMDKEGG